MLVRPDQSLPLLFPLISTILALGVLSALLTQTPQKPQGEAPQMAAFSPAHTSVKAKDNPIFSAPSNADGLSLAAGNCLLQRKSETLLLYYSHGPKGLTVYSTTSTDGLTFSKENSQAILAPGGEGAWDDAGVSIFPNCIVQKTDGSYMMYYTGSKKNGTDIYHSGQIGVAFSSDLKNWVKHDKNPILTPSSEGWDSQGVFEPSVLFSGNSYGAPQSYQMWYGGSDKNLRFQIGYAESIDGINWTKPLTSPVLSYSNQPNEFDNHSIEVHSVTQIHNGFVMLYEAVQGEFPRRFAVGLAYSRDGKNWIKSKANPVLEAGGVGSWDQMGAYHPSLFLSGDAYRIYYVGLDHDYKHQIGVAELNPSVIQELHRELSEP
jgi:predicted GH43/DUF377 family glycosyl hydrolase